MRRTFAFAGGFGLGAGLMFLFDPGAGRRRRALLRDKAVHYGKRGSTWYLRGLRDLEHRAKGSAHEIKQRATEGLVADDVLVERVRARLGRYVRHSHEVQVFADRGTLTLKGKVAEGERLPLVAGVRFIAGVKDVKDELELGDFPDGGLPRVGPFKRAMKPGTKMLASTAGGLGLALLAMNRMRA